MGYLIDFPTLVPRQAPTTNDNTTRRAAPPGDPAEAALRVLRAALFPAGAGARGHDVADLADAIAHHPGVPSGVSLALSDLAAKLHFARGHIDAALALKDAPR